MSTSHQNKQSITLDELENIALKLRKSTIFTSSKAKIPHLGSCLSCMDILVYLYWKELNINPQNFCAHDRDRFILSKGHGAPALYQVLGEIGFFDKELLKSFGENDSFFHEHPPKPGSIPGIEAATGSLGHGLPMALGMALSSKIRGLNFKCYALLSDGECNEGTIWEAAMLASSLRVNNLVAIIDFNKWQATGRSQEIMSLDPLVDKWISFGWQTLEVDGHNFNQLEQAFIKTKKSTQKPTVIVAHTIKGKGISFMEDNNNWHYRTPNESELEAAFTELNNNAL